MREHRLGDVIDDYCAKCKRLTNHSVVSLVDADIAKVRCRSCYFDHDYLKEQIPPSKKDLKKLELFNAVLSSAGGTSEAEGDTAVPIDGILVEEAADEVAADEVMDEVVQEPPATTEEPALPAEEEKPKKARGRVKKT